MFSEPVGRGEERMGLIVGEKVADDFCALCHEETLTTTELLLF